MTEDGLRPAEPTDTPGVTPACGPTCSGLSWVPDVPWRAAMILTYGALALAVVHYHGNLGFLPPQYDLFGWQAVNFVVLFLGPVLLVRLVFRERLAEYGVRLGEGRTWGRWLLVLLMVMLPVLVIASRLPDFHTFYPSYGPARDDAWLLLPSMAGWLVYFLAWEFFFRGFLLFGLGRRLGAIAIFIQMVPFVMAHFPKLELESLSAIVAGIVLGWMAWRGKSFVGPWLLHWLVATVMDCLVVFWPLH